MLNEAADEVRLSFLNARSVELDISSKFFDYSDGIIPICFFDSLGDRSIGTFL